MKWYFPFQLCISEKLRKQQNKSDAVTLIPAAVSPLPWTNHHLPCLAQGHPLCTGHPLPLHHFSPGPFVTMSPEAQACLCSGSGVHMGAGRDACIPGCPAPGPKNASPSLCEPHLCWIQPPPWLHRGHVGQLPLPREESPLVWSPYFWGWCSFTVTSDKRVELSFTIYFLF